MGSKPPPQDPRSGGIPRPVFPSHLLNYIRQNLSKFGKEAISVQLQKSGLTPEQVEAAIDEAFQEKVDSVVSGAAAKRTPGPLERKALAGSLVGLGALLFLQVLLLTVWNLHQGPPPTSGEADQLEIAERYAAAFAKGEYGSLLRLAPPPSPRLPPLYHLSILHAVDEKEPLRAARWANVFYFALLLTSIWGVGRKAFGPWAGLAAAVLMGCFAETQSLSRHVLVDFALSAWVAAAYWALFESNQFAKRLPSVLFGLAVGLGMLTKWSVPFYLWPAYWIAGGALSDRRSRLNVLLALGAAAALCAPWYLSQWPPLLPNLISISMTGLPFWKRLAFLSYVQGLAHGLEFPAFVLAVATFIQRPRSRDANALMFWFTGSFVFWTLLPNRDIRFLLPAFAPMALLIAGTWPKAVTIGFCAFQLFAAANFSYGWVRPFHKVVVLPITLFRNYTARIDDWKIAETLQEASRLAGRRGRESLTVISADPRYSGPAFDWTRRRLGIENLRVRRAGRRLCEFSEFIVVKMAPKEFSEFISVSINPFGPVSIADEDESPGSLVEPGSWFKRGYRAVKRWNLPEGTQGVLFARRRKFPNPFAERRAFFDYFEEGPFIAEKMEVLLGRWNAARGTFPGVSVRAPQIFFHGLKIKDARARLEDLTLLPIMDPGERMGETKKLLLNFRFIRMRKLRFISGSVTEKEAREFLKERIPGLRKVKVRLQGDIQARGKFLYVIPVSASASAKINESGRGVDFRLERASLAGVPLPLGLILGRHIQYTLGFDLGLPFDVEIGNLDVSDGRIQLSKR